MLGQSALYRNHNWAAISIFFCVRVHSQELCGAFDVSLERLCNDFPYFDFQARRSLKSPVFSKLHLRIERISYCLFTLWRGSRSASARVGAYALSELRMFRRFLVAHVVVIHRTCPFSRNFLESGFGK